MNASESCEPTVLTVESLRGILLAGAHRVISHRDHLDRINVFPVPDRDTGTNLALTMRAVIRALQNPLPSMAAVSATAAKGALLGAQGNSGVIFAQFFQGLREEISDPLQLSMQRFAEALRCAATRAHEALAKPREGTILTVISDVAESALRHADRLPGFRSLLDEALRVAHRSLQKTTDCLAELKRAGVVDAGALGFVHFLEGVRDFFCAEGADQSDPSLPKIEEEEVEPSDPGPVRWSFRYCTEAVVWGTDIDRHEVMERLQTLGDSVVVAGDREEIHAHVHTNVPAYVLALLSQYGTVASQKVEDMLESVGVRLQPQENADRSGIALVTDSVCDLPMAFLTDRRIHVVPVRLVFGDDALRDRVDLAPDEFYRRLQSETTLPKTSQPSPDDFIALYRHLAGTHAAILSIHISAELSGTHQSALSAARKVSEETGVPIAVIDSRSASCAEGLVMWSAAEAVRAGLSAAKCTAIAQTVADELQVFVFVPTVEYFVRGGRLSPLQGTIAHLLHLLPVLTSEDGKLVPASKALGQRHARAVVLRKVMAAARAASQPLFVVGHSAAPDLAASVRMQILQRMPHAEVWVTDTAPAIGAHSGPGGFAVAVLDRDAVRRQILSAEEPSL